MSLDLINQANLLIEKTMNSTLKDNLRNIFDDESSLSYNEFINTVNIIYSKNLITKSSRNRLLRINEKKKAKAKILIQSQSNLTVARCLSRQASPMIPRGS